MLRDLTQAAPSDRQTKWYLGFTATSWAVPVLLVLAGVSGGAVTATMLVAAFISCIAIIKRPRTVLVALPFFALLSPVAGFFTFGGVRVLLSDVLFLLLGIQLVVLAFTNRVKVRASISAQLGTLIVLLYVLSTLFGALTGTLISLKPLLYILQLSMIALFMAKFANAEGASVAVVDAWVIATCLGATLVINGFLSGNSLSSFDAPTVAAAVDRTTLEYLFRADYYYTGFHFAVGMSIVILLFRLLLGERPGHRIANAVAVAVLTIALMMMLNKTAILSVGLTLIVVFVVVSRRLPRGFTLRVVGGSAILALLGYMVVSKVLFGSISDVQRAMWGESAVSTSSLGVRLAVYVSALGSWTSRPFQVLLGMGPDFLGSSGDPALTQAFVVSSATRHVEGTVDSGWISYLVELGVVAFVALGTLMLLALKSAYRKAIRIPLTALESKPALSVFAGLVFITVALSTQMLGYTKLTWFPFQLLVLALLQQQPPVADRISAGKA